MRKLSARSLSRLARVIRALPASRSRQAAQPDARQRWTRRSPILKKSQNEDGSWGKDPQNRGVTGIVVTGLLGTGAGPDDAPVAKGAQVHRIAGQREGRAHRRQGREGRAAELRHQHQRHGPGRGRPGRQVQGGHRRRGRSSSRSPVGRGRGQEARTATSTAGPATTASRGRTCRTRSSSSTP